MKLLTAICLYFLVTTVAFAAERTALVIGISNYQFVTPLKNTVKDADAIAKALKSLDFNVVTVMDGSAAQIEKALDAFAFASETADVALVYFAGHAVEVAGKNFLIPADANFSKAEDITEKTISLPKILAAAGSARKLRIAILDACRDNPFTSLEGVSRVVSATESDSPQSRSGTGLAAPSPDRGTLVVYSAKDGAVALDGTGQHSPFAQALLAHLPTPDLEISMMFRRVRDDVLRATQRFQEPHFYGSLPGVPLFIGGVGSGDNPTAAKDPRRAWSSVRSDTESQLVALANQGDTRSMVGLAYMYQDPDSGRFKPEQATEYLLRAAFKNDTEAQFELARAYERGFGVPQDGVKALEWYQRAADQNFADAINELGFLHYSGGLGIRANPDKALKFFERAAGLGHAQAMFNYAALIDDGIVPGQTPDDAASLLYRALRAGSEDVLNELTENPDQYKQATLRGLQKKLAEFGFYESGTIDGKIGPQSKRSIKLAYGSE